MKTKTMKNGITIDGQAHELIETNEAYPYKCDHCSLLDKCVDFWGLTEENDQKLCRFMFGDEEAEDKVFKTTNFASKREQCQTCLSMAEREQSQDRDSGIN